MAVLWLIEGNAYKIKRNEIANDAESVGESIRLRLKGNQDYLLMLAKERGDGAIDAASFQERASRYVADHPEMINITWVDAAYLIRDVAPLAPNSQIVGLRLNLAEPKRVSQLARESRQPVYTRPFEAIQGNPSFEIWVPVFHDDVFLGLFGGVYSCERTLRHLIPTQMSKSYPVALEDASGKVLWELPETGTVDVRMMHRVFLTPPESGVRLRFMGYGLGVMEWSLLLLEMLCLAFVLAMAWAMWGLKREIEVRKRTEDILQKKNADMEQYLYTVSHDLRSPLVTVKNFLGFLESDVALGNQERVSQDLQFIHGAADKMKLLLDELLELSRIDHIESPPARVAIMEVVSEVLDTLAGVINERKVDIRLPDTDLILFGDRPRLCQIWQNLIENAVKYSRADCITSIEIGVRQLDGETVFFVKDNGIGIDSQYHKKIFGIFEKLDPKSPGAGLGLSMVQRVVEKSGGRIWVESEGSGKGACFLFTLPRAMVQS
ncbi:MAG: CHASE domain-containing protein [Desulfuromonadales bacterium]|nr:CHASE domain-containing protein [Desulfuromonadales bacterium]